jgi:hypothetical protein
MFLIMQLFPKSCYSLLHSSNYFLTNLSVIKILEFIEIWKMLN